jgi:hypothetical protein
MVKLIAITLPLAVICNIISNSVIIRSKFGQYLVWFLLSVSLSHSLSPRRFGWGLSPICKVLAHNQARHAKKR